MANGTNARQEAYDFVLNQLITITQNEKQAKKEKESKAIMQEEEKSRWINKMNPLKKIFNK